MTVLWTSKSLTEKALVGQAQMFEAAMPTGKVRKDQDDHLNTLVARSVARQEEIRRVMADAAIVAEACRLTDQLCDVHWLDRGVKHTAAEIAAIGIGYFNELKAVQAKPRESSDPFILIDGEPFHLHTEGDPDERPRIFAIWNRTIPDCPACSEPMFDSLGRAPVTFSDQSEPVAVICDCGASFKVIR